MKKKYPVITLCGSTRFRKEFEEMQKKLTLKGNIIISVGLFGHDGDLNYGKIWMRVHECILKRCLMICIKKE